MSSPTHQTWGGRFQEPLDQFVTHFTASIHIDQRLAPYDIEGSLAHVKMLAHCNILTLNEAEQLSAGLNQIAEEIAQQRFIWQESLEDVHMNIEARLVELIGPVGKKLHTGRSRNDQVATDLRLYLRAQIDFLYSQLHQLRMLLAQQALHYAETIMPGFTHLQIAQPITFGHHLLAWQAMIARDSARLQDCRRRLNIMPLGAAALAGTSFAIDRQYSAQLLGFSAPSSNSLDAVSDRDFVIEFLSAASLIMMHFSRICEELVLWSSTPFAFIELPDRFSTGSSIMPQKKNPDVPELIRGKTGRVYGHLFSLLTIMKSQPLAYNKDNQEDKEPLFDSIDTVTNCLRALIEILPTLKVNAENMYSTALSGYSTATDLADYLVRQGLPFRDAHEACGQIVAYAIAHQLNLDEIELTTLQRFAPVINNDVYAVLTLTGSINARQHFGATAPKQVRQAAQQILTELAMPQESL